VNADLEARIRQAFSADDRKTHQKHAVSRDLMLNILADHPELFDDPSGQDLIRGAAERCANIGPFSTAVGLYQKLVLLSNSATDYFKLSEVLAQCDHVDEAITALKKAIELDPATYDTISNRETLEMAT
jgi:tetratricopeptide (TPR) repeat protein